ncbi:hypothetical protein CVIRNUC_004933 [Coccomyxa viridis]|uniref:TF-B3 domain-containing protein n=1 Tax=Coccomyxa viridis TaxID=1274662 RepID=A0AAV1I5Z7_9CHLO|nr:hypothetical protein CVIRNUC_004933 [Coccomyxa viridis]
MACEGPYPASLASVHQDMPNGDTKGAENTPTTMALRPVQPGTPVAGLQHHALACSHIAAHAPAAEAAMHDARLWPASILCAAEGDRPAAVLHATVPAEYTGASVPAEYTGAPDSLAAKLRRSFGQAASPAVEDWGHPGYMLHHLGSPAATYRGRYPPNLDQEMHTYSSLPEAQMFTGSLLDGTQNGGFPSSHGGAYLHSGHMNSAAWLPAAAPQQLYGHSEALQVSSEALGLSLYAQPLRGQPINMLPGFDTAALEVHALARAAPAQEAAPATAHSPRIPLRRTHTADGELSTAEVSGVDVEVVQACDASVEAEWQRTALPGSPQQMPSTPRRGGLASLQHQSIAQKRKKVDEDLSPGQDHIYVVFLLPVLEPGRHRGRGAWGADAAAASLMGLSGHSYAAKGPARCQWLFSKCLTASDTNKLARIILPRQAVDAFLPHVEDRAGLDLDAWDTAGARWTFKLKFWMNGSNPKRMYVLENVRDFVSLHSLQAGSTLSFFYAPDNRLVIDTRPVEDYFDLPGKA